MAKKKSTAPAGADLDQDERLIMATNYIERAMQQILTCAAALDSKSSIDQRLIVQGIAYTLQYDIHNDLDVAKEIFQTWKAEEAARG